MPVDDVEVLASLQRLYDVRGVHALVTGAGSGLGRAIAEVLASCGAVVTLADRDLERVEQTRSRLAERGGEVAAVAVDVGDEEAIDTLFAQAEARAPLDVVFANAGIGGGRGYAWSSDGGLADVDLELWERVLSTNLSGVLLTMRAAARAMIPRRRGKIVVTVSVAGLRPDPMVGYPYSATKAAVANLVRHGALELAHHEITVTGIAPGPFRTNIGGSQPPSEEAVRAWAATVPLARMADPEELKGLALLLASPSSSFMTGSVIAIDGGSTIAAPGM